MPFVVYQVFTESLLGDAQVDESRIQTRQGYVEVIGTAPQSDPTSLFAHQNFLQVLGNVQVQDIMETNQSFVETIGFANTAPRAYTTNVYVENVGFSVDVRAYNTSLYVESLGYATEPSIMRSSEIYVENIGIGDENQVAFSQHINMEIIGLPYPPLPPEQRTVGVSVETIGWANQTNPQNEEEITYHVWIN